MYLPTIKKCLQVRAGGNGGTQWFEAMGIVHRAKNQNRKPIRLIQGSGEKAFTQLVHGLCFLFIH